MKQIVTAITNRLSGNVDGIVSSINRSVDRLERAAQRHDRRVKLLNEAGNLIRERAYGHYREASRARRVAENFRRLTK